MERDRPVTSIGPARASELGSLARLGGDQPLLARYGLDEAWLAGSLERALGDGDRLVVARGPCAPVGFAWWIPRGAFGRSPYLRLLVVSAGATGRGVGSALMDAVESDAFGTSADLFLLVASGNDGARRFYANRGFETVGLLHAYVLPDVDEVVMRKLRPHVTR